MLLDQTNEIYYKIFYTIFLALLLIYLMVRVFVELKILTKENRGKKGFQSENEGFIIHLVNFVNI